MYAVQQGHCYRAESAPLVSSELRLRMLGKCRCFPPSAAEAEDSSRWAVYLGGEDSLPQTLSVVKTDVLLHRFDLPNKMNN